MPNSRQRSQNHKRDRARTPSVELELFVHDKNACQCRVEFLSVELEPERQLLQILHYDDRMKLVWFGIFFHKTNGEGRGLELYSVDTGHGHFHEHTTGHRKRNDRKDISPLYSQVHVQECFDTGDDIVMNKYSAMSGR